MDLSALTSAALERRVEEPEDDEVEKHRKFEEHRKAHYKVDLAALRAQAAAEDEEEEDDE